MESVMSWLMLVPMVIGGASMLAAAVAPLTKTQADDKLAVVLNKLHGLLSTLGLHTPSVNKAKKSVEVLEVKPK